MTRPGDALRRWKAGFNAALPDALADPAGERRARAYVDWIDHGILRYLWHNEFEVAPGLWRANHPGRARLEAFARRGGRTVLSLRSAGTAAPQVLEARDCKALGLDFVSAPLAARVAPRPERLLHLIGLFPTLERPILMHCKSGADRTSLAAAVYLLEFEGADIAAARRQMSPRFIHFRWTATGILDRFLDVYEARLTHGPIRLSDWIANEYDPDALTESFARSRWRRRA